MFQPTSTNQIIIRVIYKWEYIELALRLLRWVKLKWDSLTMVSWWVITVMFPLSLTAEAKQKSSPELLGFKVKPLQFCGSISMTMMVSVQRTSNSAATQRRGGVAIQNWSRFMVTPIFVQLENKSIQIYKDVFLVLVLLKIYCMCFCCQGPWWNAMWSNKQRRLPPSQVLLYRP